MNKKQDDFYIDYHKEIKKLYGNIKRTRFCYLYTEKGVRLTDMYQDNGRAILGYKYGKTTQVFKNIFERGVISNLPNDYSTQPFKALKKLFPNCRQVLYFTSARLPEDIKALPVYRPWLDDIFTMPETFLFYPPFAWTNVLLLISSSKEALNIESDFLPSPVSAALTRSIFDLVKELTLRSEKDWQIFDDKLSKKFTRKGPYLYPKCSKQEYKTLFLNALENHVLLSPDYETPSIIPYNANQGDLNF